MSRPLRASIPHSLGQAEARRRVADGIGQLQRQTSISTFGMFALRGEWQGDRLEFHGGTLGQKLTGRLDVGPDAIHVEVDVPEFLAAIAEKVASVLTRETQKLLGKGSS